MKNKNLYIAAGIVALVLVLFFASKQSGSSPVADKTREEGKTAVNNPAAKTPTTQKSTQTTKTSAPISKTSSTGATAPSKFPDIEFIDKRIDFPLTDFPDVKVTIEKVAFGRGDAAMSTGCSGIPNVNFSTYLYPGSGICLGTSELDGSPRGIVAIHMLVDNRGNIGFGGNAKALRLNYLRADASGKPVSKFANPVMGLDSYYIDGYSSKKIILSYVVPEDQLIFNLVAGYKEPTLETSNWGVYDLSVNGLLIDFGSKSLKVVK